MSTTEHPSRDDLFAFLVGTLPEEAAETVGGHLEQCTTCQETLAGLDEAQDPLAAKLRLAGVADPYAAEP